MNTKALIIAILLTVNCLVANAQFGSGGTKAIKKLKNTKTMVILGYSEAYNDAIKEAFENNWSFTEVRFISGAQYKKYCNDDGYSFVHLLTIKDWQLTKEEYDDVGIVLGGKCRTGPNDMVAYANMEVWDPTYYRLECKRAVQFIQAYLELGMSENLSDDNDTETVALYAKGKHEMNGKTLILGEADLAEEVRTLPKIKEYYTHPVKLVPQLTIDRAVWRGEEDVMYTIFVFDIHGYSYHLIIEAKNNKILYATPTKSGQGYLVRKKMLHKFDDF